MAAGGASWPVRICAGSANSRESANHERARLPSTGATSVFVSIAALLLSFATGYVFSARRLMTMSRRRTSPQRRCLG
ncbi:LPXTG cell wall anchor domain-containing protein [Nonomuraea turkmeniaca]|uniref:LPXTG cell wall anchor domain-containing protein n=1 Tax=Nonomuraea turkmeniaca TaxID=103838 RepID=A0A5S4FDU3_9ACTN|nr:LPXTG cell wall anchor domain-containing protein [Nonomuraea turkmeniaca]